MNQNILQMCLKIVPANFFSSPYLIQRFLNVFDIFKVSSQLRKSEFRVFSIVHLNIYYF